MPRRGRFNLVTREKAKLLREIQVQQKIVVEQEGEVEAIQKLISLLLKADKQKMNTPDFPCVYDSFKNHISPHTNKTA